MRFMEKASTKGEEKAINGKEILSKMTQHQT